MNQWNWSRGAQFGGPFKDEQGMYQHGGFCSGIGYYPRRPGNTCSCYRSDLMYRKLGLVFNREEGVTRRTLWVSVCPTCAARREFPFTEEPTPRETYCQTCGVWAKVVEVAWEGQEFNKLLPVFPRRR